MDERNTKPADMSHVATVETVRSLGPHGTAWNHQMHETRRKQGTLKTSLCPILEPSDMTIMDGLKVNLAPYFGQTWSGHTVGEHFGHVNRSFSPSQARCDGTWASCCIPEDMSLFVFFGCPLDEKREAAVLCFEVWVLGTPPF